MITAKQIKAARALLSLVQGDLSEMTGLSVTTIRNLESDPAPSGKPLQTVRNALEAAGLEFLDGEGLRRRTQSIKVIEGLDSIDKLFDDIEATIKRQPGEVLAVFKSINLLKDLCGFKKHRLGPLEDVIKKTMVKCLLPAQLDPSFLQPNFQARATLHQYLGASSYIIYGNKHAFIVPEGQAHFHFIVQESASLVIDWRSHFSLLWDLAPPNASEVERRFKS